MNSLSGKWKVNVWAEYFHQNISITNYSLLLKFFLQGKEFEVAGICLYYKDPVNNPLFVCSVKQ